MCRYRLISFWKTSWVRMRWSLEVWMKHRRSSFGWNLMHKHNIIQYIKVVNIKYFIFSRKVSCMFEFGLIMCRLYRVLLLTTKDFSHLSNVCYPMLYLLSSFRYEHRNIKKLVSISYLGDALLCIGSQYC